MNEHESLMLESFKAVFSEYKKELSDQGFYNADLDAIAIKFDSLQKKMIALAKLYFYYVELKEVFSIHAITYIATSNDGLNTLYCLLGIMRREVLRSNEIAEIAKNNNNLPALLHLLESYQSSENHITTRAAMLRDLGFSSNEIVTFALKKNAILIIDALIQHRHKNILGQIIHNFHVIEIDCSELVQLAFTKAGWEILQYLSKPFTLADNVTTRAEILKNKFDFSPSQFLTIASYPNSIGVIDVLLENMFDGINVHEIIMTHEQNNFQVLSYLTQPFLYDIHTRQPKTRLKILRDDLSLPPVAITKLARYKLYQEKINSLIESSGILVRKFGCNSIQSILTNNGNNGLTKLLFLVKKISYSNTLKTRLEILLDLGYESNVIVRIVSSMNRAEDFEGFIKSAQFTQLPESSIEVLSFSNPAVIVPLSLLARGSFTTFGQPPQRTHRNSDTEMPQQEKNEENQAACNINPRGY